jgi:hypothetical protein
MGLIQTEIAELRDLAKKVMADEVSIEKASVQIGIYNQVSKRVSQLIQIAAITVKDSGKTWKRMDSMNILSDNVAVDVISSGKIEMVKCPEQGGTVIDREECLDFSGTSENIDRCQKCDQFIVTRKYIK